MYGTIARLRIKAGAEETLMRIGERYSTAPPKGMVFQQTYRSDADPQVYWLVVGFENKDAYVANASSPEQNERYMEFRALLEADPEWHDGEIVQSFRTM